MENGSRHRQVTIVPIARLRSDESFNEISRIDEFYDKQIVTIEAKDVIKLVLRLVSKSKHNLTT